MKIIFGKFYIKNIVVDGFCVFHMVKGTVQRDLRGVKSGINR
jgi:hypothetical protein